MNTPAVPASRQADPVVRLNEQLTSRAQQFAMVLPSHISPEKFQRTVLTAVQADADLLTADRTSLILACMKAAQDGLLPDKREAALVIFKRNFKDSQGSWQTAKEVAYMPMVYGLRKKILQSGEITDIAVNVVYRREVDEGAFLYEEGSESMLRHRPLLDLTEDDARDSNIIAAYSMATYKDGTKSYEVMRRFEIDKVRECSQTGATKDRKGQNRKPSGPWVEWFSEQAKKTVMRRHSKSLPMSSDLIDVEAREIDLMARSSQAVLTSRAPDSHDPATGEIHAIEDRSGTEAGMSIDIDDAAVESEMATLRDPATSMTLVDEATARELDQGSERDPIPSEESESDRRLRAFRDKIAAAKNAQGLKAVDGEWLNVRAAYDDLIAAEIDGLINARRKELSK